MSLLKITLIAILGLYVLVCILIYFFQERLIFLPERLSHDFQYDFNVLYEEHFLTTNDGVLLNALYFKAEYPKGVIYYHHGNAGNLNRWGLVAEFYVDQGYDVLMYDYRGYGKSEGDHNEQAMYEDAQLLYDWLKGKWREDEIIVFGRSLGTGLASYIAGKNTPRMVVLETPFFSLLDAAGSHFSFLPIKYLSRYAFPNFMNLQECTAPIYVFHGSRDELVPFASGKRLYESLNSGKAFFYEIPGGHHNDLIEFDLFRQEMIDLLQ
ncbi:MAG: alpha/beta hydrolase [Cyclobacteriaceae bacterium]|nr:alpha/beta hydrolase [Cyclobacteriaceae bacterium HetDA_MAG_MS6]